jgi:uncharacterized protein YgfB (UPF0149 family)
VAAFRECLDDFRTIAQNFADSDADIAKKADALVFISETH